MSQPKQPTLIDALIPVISLIFSAMAFGAVLEHSGMLMRLVEDEPEPAAA